MSPATTFLSLPRMSRTRKRFALGYLLFVLILVIIYHIPWERLNQSAGGEWDSYYRWLGPAPAGLEMQMTRDEDNPSIFYIFTYDPAPETDRIITGIDPAIADFHLTAAVDVNPVIVGIGMTENVQSVDSDIFAVAQMTCPRRRIPQP